MLTSSGENSLSPKEPQLKWEFCEIKDLDIDEMMRNLNELVQNRENISSEVDDITIIGFELVKSKKR